MSVKHQVYRVSVTPAALQAMEESGQEWDFFLGMHLGGIGSDAESEHNEEARARRGVLLNKYRTLKGREILVVTDIEQSNSMLLCSDEA